METAKIILSALKHRITILDKGSYQKNSSALKKNPASKMIWLLQTVWPFKNKLTASEAKFITCDMKMIPQLNWAILMLG